MTIQINPSFVEVMGWLLIMALIGFVLLLFLGGCIWLGIKAVRAWAQRNRLWLLIVTIARAKQTSYMSEFMADDLVEELSRLGDTNSEAWEVLIRGLNQKNERT